MIRIVIAPLAWVFVFFAAAVVAMLFSKTAIDDKIPVGFVLLGIAVVGISVPINLAIHGVVLEHIFRLARQHTGAIGSSFVLLTSASAAIGLSLSDFWRDHQSDLKMFFAIPIPIASIATFWLHYILMPKRMR